MARLKITNELLIAYAAGELDAETKAAVEARLMESGADAKKLGRLSRIIETMQTDDSMAPSSDVIARAKALFDAASLAPASGWLAQLQEIVANLIFDSRRQPALAGYRGASDSAQLTYQSDVADVDLQLTPPASGQESGWTIMGQISADESMEGAEVAVFSTIDSTPAAETRPDEHGMFTTRVAPGEYYLLIRISDKVIRIPDVSIN